MAQRRPGKSSPLEDAKASRTLPLWKDLRKAVGARLHLSGKTRRRAGGSSPQGCIFDFLPLVRTRQEPRGFRGANGTLAAHKGEERSRVCKRTDAAKWAVHPRAVKTNPVSHGQGVSVQLFVRRSPASSDPVVAAQAIRRRLLSIIGSTNRQYSFRAFRINRGDLISYERPAQAAETSTVAPLVSEYGQSVWLR